MEQPTKLTIKLLPTHREAVENLARAEQEPVSVIVRRLIKAEAQRQGLWPAKGAASQ